LRARLRELAAERRRFGYRRLGYLLAREGITPNHKKLLQIYRVRFIRNPTFTDVVANDGFVPVSTIGGGKLWYVRASGATASQGRNTDDSVNFTTAGTAEVEHPPLLSQICISVRRVAMSRPVFG
jgi:hypothetical protein